MLQEAVKCGALGHMYRVLASSPFGRMQKPHCLRRRMLPLVAAAEKEKEEDQEEGEARLPTSMMAAVEMMTMMTRQ